MRRPPTNRPRRVPRQERSRATVEAILGATARVLVRRGCEGATTVRIAEESGYGVGSLYDYSPNKARAGRVELLRPPKRRRPSSG